MPRFLLAALALLVSTWAVTAASLAAESGTAAEARAMLERAVTELNADQAVAIEKLNEGGAGFRDRDLYVFCADGEGKLVVHVDPAILGRDLSTFKDPTGKEFGKEILRSAKEGEIAEVEYLFPRPGETEAVAKQSYVTKVGGLACGVGYYK